MSAACDRYDPATRPARIVYRDAGRRSGGSEAVPAAETGPHPAIGTRSRDRAGGHSGADAPDARPSGTGEGTVALRLRTAGCVRAARSAAGTVPPAAISRADLAGTSGSRSPLEIITKYFLIIV